MWRTVEGRGIERTPEDSPFRRVNDIVTGIDEKDDRFMGAVAPPIYENSIYRLPDFATAKSFNKGEVERYMYGKNANPTTDALAHKLALLEGGEAAQCYSSGTAAIFTALMAGLQHGGHIIVVKNVYGRTSGFLKQLFHPLGVTTTYVDGTELQAIEDAIRPDTKVIYLESPTSWQFELQPIQDVADLARKHNITTMIDNTWATPVFQNPIGLGIDLVIHSASKYLGGHSDLVAGAIIGSRERIAQLPQLGAVLSPHESAKLMKGLRTLPIRMERHEKSAMKIADYLHRNGIIHEVRYPGLPAFGQHELARQQMRGCSGLLSFTLDTDLAGVERFINGLRHVSIGGSWGGFDSIIYTTAMSANAEEMLLEGFIPTQCRLSVGLEHADTLLEDLDQALRKV